MKYIRVSVYRITGDDMPEMTASQRRRLDRDQEIAGLEAERDYLTKQLLTIRAHAGDATEYVLAQINKELVEERDHLQTEFDSLAKSFLKSGEDKHNLITERDELRALLEDMKAAVDRGHGTPPLWAFGERIKAALGDDE